MRLVQVGTKRTAQLPFFIKSNDFHSQETLQKYISGRYWEILLRERKIFIITC